MLVKGSVFSQWYLAVMKCGLIFNYYFIEHRHIFWAKGENVVPGLFLVLLNLYCSIYRIHKFYIFTFFSEFLKFRKSKLLRLCMRHHCYKFARYQLLLQNYFNSLLVVELKIYCEKHLAEENLFIYLAIPTYD